MSKEDIIKSIELLDEELTKNEEIGFVYIPTSKILMDFRNMLCDMLLCNYGVFYD